MGKAQGASACFIKISVTSGEPPGGNDGQLRGLDLPCFCVRGEPRLRHGKDADHYQLRYAMAAAG
jgi:hypothetical protein